MLRIVRAVDLPPRPPSRDGWPILCLLPLQPPDVPGAVWEDFEIDGLGRYRGACVEVEGGFSYGLDSCLETDVPWRGMHVYAFTEPERLAEALDALLRASGLAREDLAWVSPDAT